MKTPKRKARSRRAGRPRSEQARCDILAAAYNLLRAKGFQTVGSHEIASAAGVSSATLYRWWGSKEEILLDACFEHMKPVLAVSGSGSALTRLRRYVVARHQMQPRFIREAIASGELKRGTDVELLIDALNGPMFFRWLQAHAPLDEGFAERIFEKVIPAFQTE